MTLVNVKCDGCGCIILRHDYFIKGKKNHYCSNACMGRAYREIHKQWTWACSCGAGGRKPMARFRAKKNGRMHLRDFHGWDKLFEITVTKVSDK